MKNPNEKSIQPSKIDLETFFESLSEEKIFFRLNLKDIMNSRIIIEERLNDKMIGISGIREHKWFNVLFVAVRSEFQSADIGEVLVKRLIRISNGKCDHIVATVFKNNCKAIPLFKQLGFKIFFIYGNKYYMVYIIKKTKRTTFLNFLISFFEAYPKLLNRNY